MSSRLPDVWGNDANEWNPMRFVDASEEKQVKVGILANLLVSSHPRYSLLLTSTGFLE